MFTKITASEMLDNSVHVACAFVVDSQDVSGEVVKLVETIKGVRLTWMT